MVTYRQLCLHQLHNIPWRNQFLALGTRFENQKLLLRRFQWTSPGTSLVEKTWKGFCRTLYSSLGLELDYRIFAFHFCIEMNDEGVTPSTEPHFSKNMVTSQLYCKTTFSGVLIFSLVVMWGLGLSCSSSSCFNKLLAPVAQWQTLFCLVNRHKLGTQPLFSCKITPAGVCGTAGLAYGSWEGIKKAAQV